ncbi:MAG: prepilin-type N-terminal cleavage/methylation domain-containing protein [Nitrospirota bacterium]
MSLFLSNPPIPPLEKGGKGGFDKGVLRGIISKGRQGGFTLIEILIAVAILSIVLAAIYSTFFLSHRAIEGMDESLLKLQEYRKAIDILRRELDSASFYKDDSNTFLKIEDRDIYGKQATKLTFTTFSTLRPGLSMISYYIEEKDGKLNLFKKVESPYANKDNPPSPPFSKGGLGGLSDETEGVDIIEDIEEFTIEAKYNDRWVKTWDTDITKGMPGEIRICLSMIIKGRKVDLFDVSRPRVGKMI